jgi:hypothetical protein
MILAVVLVALQLAAEPSSALRHLEQGNAVRKIEARR